MNSPSAFRTRFTRREAYLFTLDAVRWDEEPRTAPQLNASGVNEPYNVSAWQQM